MSSLDDLAVYVFVRQDLTDQDQRIQIAHAVLKMALAYHPAEANYKIVELDGGATGKAFNRTVRTMPTRGVAHVIYQDSDRPEWGNTAIATVPSPQGVLPHKLRRNSPVAQQSERACSPVSNPGLTGELCEVGGANPSGRANFNFAPVAQEREHLTSSQEVDCSSQSGSSTLNCS